MAHCANVEPESKYVPGVRAVPRAEWHDQPWQPPQPVEQARDGLSALGMAHRQLLKLDPRECGLHRAGLRVAGEHPGHVRPGPFSLRPLAELAVQDESVTCGIILCGDQAALPAGGQVL